MVQWKYKINIKQHLGEDTSFEAIAKAAAGVQAELKRLPDAWLDIKDSKYDPSLDDMFNIFQCIAKDAESKDGDEDDLLEEFNYNLNELYDWADAKHVWLGL